MVTLHEQGRRSRRFVAAAPSNDVQFSTTHADITIGQSTVRVLPDGRYAVHARAREEHGAGVVEIDLAVSPSPGAHFPGAALSSGEVVSGYVVPALRADADGRLCVGEEGRSLGCEQLRGVQAYHDHNWGDGPMQTLIHNWYWARAKAGPYTVIACHITATEAYGYETQILYILAKDGVIVADDDARALGYFA